MNLKSRIRVLEYINILFLYIALFLVGISFGLSIAHVLVVNRMYNFLIIYAAIACITGIFLGVLQMIFWKKVKDVVGRFNELTIIEKRLEKQKKQLKK